MAIFNSSVRYGAVAKSLHWLTVVFVALCWLLGIAGDALPAGSAQRSGLLIHIFAGLAILALLAARLAWRAIDRPPPSETGEAGSEMAKWLDLAARIVHYSLYFLLFAVPVAGIVLQFARGEPLPLFGLAEIQSPWLKDRAFAHNVKELHEIVAHALVIVATLHGAAALVHHWIFRDRALVRMLPHFGK